MQVERVQQWVMSALVLTTATVFAGGLVALAGSADRAGALPGLVGIACVVVALAVAGCRLILGRTPLTGWLVVAVAPAVAAYLIHR